jgi:hypothetical protein
MARTFPGLEFLELGPDGAFVGLTDMTWRGLREMRPATNSDKDDG